MSKEKWHELPLGALLTRDGKPKRLSARRKTLPSAAVLDSIIRHAEKIAGPFAVGKWEFNKRTGSWEASLTP